LAYKLESKPCLIKKNKIEVILGMGKVKPGKKVEVTAADGKVTEYSASHIILATGARSRQLPNLPQDGKKIIGYRDAMSLTTQPKSMVVVGSGAIGVHLPCRILHLHRQRRSRR
jgi:dihydrolipoamide dehydrogenase